MRPAEVPWYSSHLAQDLLRVVMQRISTKIRNFRPMSSTS
jgi:hypothetical protein